jgi:hypothetical protein
MSLAEDLPRSYAGSLSRPTAAHKLSRVSLADLANRTVPSAESRLAASRPAPVTVPAPPSEPEAPAVVPLPRRVETGDSSLDLLDRASKGMSFMLSRYKQLEDHVKQVDDWCNAQIQAAEKEAARWQEEAAAAEKRLEESQRTLEIMVRRAESAEQAMHRDREALTVLQERIMDSFGFGSAAHDAITTGLELG